MSIIRTIHNKENPFVQLNKNALWDDRLSLKAVGLWARCLSRPEDWKFSINELAKKCIEGRKSIITAIDELIEHGYAVRIDYWKKAEDGKFCEKGCEYVFFEFIATQEDKEKVLEELKKFYHKCRFGTFRRGTFQKDNLLIKSLTENEDTNTKNNPLPPDPEPPANAGSSAIADVDVFSFSISQKALETTDEMIKILEKGNPTYRAPKNTLPLRKEVKIMVDIDKQDPGLLLKVFRWAVEDNEERGGFKGWSSVLYCKNPAKKFREKFSTIYQQMNSKPKSGVDRRGRNADGTPWESSFEVDPF